jgi:hypothetical protein
MLHRRHPLAQLICAFIFTLVAIVSGHVLVIELFRSQPRSPFELVVLALVVAAFIASTHHLIGVLARR